MFGDLELIPEEGKVLREGNEIHLTKTEFRLLCELAENRGKVFSREELLDKVWGYDYFGDGRLVDVHIRRLRTKVEADPGRARATSSPSAGSATACRVDRAVTDPSVTAPGDGSAVTGDGRRLEPDRVLDTPDAISAVAPPPEEVAPGDELGAMAERPAGADGAVAGVIRGRLTGTVGLRRRILLTFTLGSLALSAFLAITTYGLVRSNLLDQRDSASVETARPQRPGGAERAAHRARHQRARPSSACRTSASRARSSATTTSGRPGSAARYSQLDIPTDLQIRVLEDGQWARMITDVGDDTTALVVGIPIPAARRLLRVLLARRGPADAEQRRACRCSSPASSRPRSACCSASSPPAAPCGRWPTPPRPPRRSPAATSSTRLPPSDDPDLGVLASSFNDMAAALQQRIERDARFASDVSHELRSPLMTLSASVEVMEARRHELPERAPVGPRPADERRQPVPGPRRGPARDQPLRRRRHPPAPRGPAGRPSSCATPWPSAPRPTSR